jgi:hypothetical protein
MAYAMATEMLWREEWYLEDPTKRLNLVQCNTNSCGVFEILLTFTCSDHLDGCLPVLLHSRVHDDYRRGHTSLEPVLPRIPKPSFRPYLGHGH